MTKDITAQSAEVKDILAMARHCLERTHCVRLGDTCEAYDWDSGCELTMDNGVAEALVALAALRRDEND